MSGMSDRQIMRNRIEGISDSKNNHIGMIDLIGADDTQHTKINANNEVQYLTSSSQTLSKYLSIVSTNEWINSNIASSF